MNGVSIEADASVYERGKGIIVDSGTTDTYLPKSAAKGFSKAWEATTGSVSEEERKYVTLTLAVLCCPLEKAWCDMNFNFMRY